MSVRVCVLGRVGWDACGRVFSRGDTRVLQESYEGMCWRPSNRNYLTSLHKIIM